jgi:hypothetical protein
MFKMPVCLIKYYSTNYKTQHVYNICFCMDHIYKNRLFHVLKVFLKFKKLL